VTFVRSDLAGSPRIPMTRDSLVANIPRHSAVGNGGAEVHTIEHFAASLLALGIDNLEVEIDGPEVPGMDGSGLPFVDALRKAGRTEQKAPRKLFRLDETVAIQNGDSSIVAFPAEEGLRISYTLSYPEIDGLRSQHVALDVEEDRFIADIAPARTFCLESEARALQDAGYGKGANTRNTLVIGEQGLFENTLRFDDEPARHKILDLVGDLSMLGADLQANVVAIRTGHAMNHELVRKVGARMSELETRGVIQRDTGLGIQDILKIIPHRYPFLFVDRVIELVGYQRAVAIKNVSFNEPFFQGHWPGQPIMPGVLQVEALAQLSGVLLLRKIQNTGKVAVLLAIDKIKFRRPVVPGDQLRLQCDTIFLKSRSGKVLGRATVNDELTCEAVMKFMLMDA
jgi:UDP-3-O-[3-hydroxymyristoyl] N-acetylglucosamine deacetylase/3-hydroxyacyl-[acyl-carrier-protein] dehydratase